MQTVLERVVSVLLTLSALAIAFVLVRREFVDTKVSPSRSTEPGYEADWREAIQAGRVVGNPSARVMVVVLSDFECPFCKRFHESLNKAVAKHPLALAYTFVHFPLPGHPHAIEAARLAECAVPEGMFRPTIDFIFENQDSLGIQDWGWFARGAGIHDQAKLSDCMAEVSLPTMVELGLAAGVAFKAKGTPLVFLNGWRYPGAPTDEEFGRAVDDLVSGKAPYAGFPSSELVASTSGTGIPR